MKYKGIIFDLDGVICFTDEYHYLAWKEIGENIGIFNFTREDNNRQRGVSRMESLEILLEKSKQIYNSEEKIILSEKKNQIYRKLLGRMSKEDLSPETYQTLVELKNKGLKLAIGSSSKNARYILNKLELLDFFDAISDGNYLVHTKPNPEVFLKAAKMIKLDPKELMVIEDADAGIEAALAGGFTAVAIGAARTSNKADFNIDSLPNLLQIIGT